MLFSSALGEELAPYLIKTHFCNINAFLQFCWVVLANLDEGFWQTRAYFCSDLPSFCQLYKRLKSAPCAIKRWLIPFSQPIQKPVEGISIPQLSQSFDHCCTRRIKIVVEGLKQHLRHRNNLILT